MIVSLGHVPPHRFVLPVPPVSPQNRSSLAPGTELPSWNCGLGADQPIFARLSWDTRYASKSRSVCGYANRLRDCGLWARTGACVAKRQRTPRYTPITDSTATYQPPEVCPKFCAISEVNGRSIATSVPAGWKPCRCRSRPSRESDLGHSTVSGVSAGTAPMSSPRPAAARRSSGSTRSLSTAKGVGRPPSIRSPVESAPNAPGAPPRAVPEAPRNGPPARIGGIQGSRRGTAAPILDSPPACTAG